jgi:hypothetical protein
MASLAVAGKNPMLSGLTGVALYCSLHTADPGTTGASELSGGSPAYARKAITWAAPAAGAVSNSVALTFDVPAATIGWMSYWSAASAGTCYGGHPLDSSQVFATQGTYVIAIGALSESL